MCRIWVLIVLSAAGLQAGSAWEILKAAAASRSEVTRTQALVALAAIGPQPDAIKLIEHACSDPVEEIRTIAAQELGELNSTSSVKVLEPMLDDPSAGVAFAAAQSLWKMKDYRGRKLVAAVLAGSGRTDSGALHGMVHDAQMKLHNRASLVKIGVDQGAGFLLGPFALPLGFAEDLFKDKGAPARALSATLLGKDTDPATIQDLETALTDKNAAVRASAAKALGERGHVESIPKIEPLFSDRAPGTRLIAAAAVVRLQAPPAPAPARKTRAGRRRS